MVTIKLYETAEDLKNGINGTVLGKTNADDIRQKAESYRTIFNYNQYIAVTDDNDKLIACLHKENYQTFNPTTMIKGVTVPVEIEGDKKADSLFGISRGIICQQVNCQNRMGSGLAKAIMDKYPIVAESYHKTFHNHTKEELFGTYQIVKISDSLYVANIYSQFDCGNAFQTGRIYTDAEKLISGIMTIADTYAGIEVYIPVKIGCGLGGEDWDRISAIINQLPMRNLFMLDTINEEVIEREYKPVDLLKTEEKPVEKTVCFTGGRPKNMFGYKDFKSYSILKENMKQQIRLLINDGYKTFITGGAQGFDQLACRCIIDLQKEYEGLKNIIYVPYKGQESKWLKEGLFSQEEYNYLLSKADEVKVLSDSFSYNALFKRNEKMIDDADLVFAYYEDDSWKDEAVKGGTAGALRYAQKKNKPIIQVYGKESKKIDLDKDEWQPVTDEELIM